MMLGPLTLSPSEREESTVMSGFCRSRLARTSMPSGAVVTGAAMALQSASASPIDVEARTRNHGWRRVACETTICQRPSRFT